MPRRDAGTPVVLQISQNAVRYHGALAPIGLATLALARNAAVPVVVHLDHATELDLVEKAIALGFGSVMFDASAMPYEENVAATTAVVPACHDGGLESRLSSARSAARTGSMPRAPAPVPRKRRPSYGHRGRCARSRRGQLACDDRAARLA